MKTKNTPVITLYLWLIIFCLTPLFLVFFISILTQDKDNIAAFPLTLSHYGNLLSWAFLKVFLKSLLLASVTTLACLLLAYPFSYILVKSKRTSLLLVLIIIPFWTSSLIRTYALIALLKYQGLLNMFLLKIHLISTPIAFLYSNYAVLIGLIYNLFPFMVLPLYTSMERFNFQWIEAAKDLGADKWEIFFRIFLPNTKQGIYSGILLVFLPAMTLFYIPNILGGARSLLLGNYIQNQFVFLDNWPQGAATSMTLTLILFGIFFCLQRPSKRRMA